VFWDRFAEDVLMNQLSTSQSDNDMSDDVLQRAIASIQAETIPAGPPPQLIADTLHVLQKSEQPTQKSVRFVPRSKTIKTITAAASLLFIVGTATLVTLGIKTPSSAFGQALKQLREARSMTYVQLMTIKGQQQPVRTRVFIAENGRKRNELLGIGGSGGVTTIFDAGGYMRITLIEASKTALVPEAKENQAVHTGADFLSWLQALKKLGDKPEKQLGQKELEGRRVTGFVATQGTFTFTMWVDNATGQPVRIEYTAPIKGAGYDDVAMTDFRFDQKLDESLFSFDVPAGYKVLQQLPVPSVPGGETSVIEALRGYTRRDGGKFPSSLADWGPWAVLFSKDNSGGLLSSESTRVLAHLGAITPFLMSMPKDSYAYLGKGKTLDQKDAIVFWYKKPDGAYRAIYGDLSAKDVKAENLPKK
jgi:outer membrane lipoprotein-sorting protein